MNVLVTGGAGYIGSHACQAFHSAGLIPITYDNLSTGHRDAVKWGPLEIGDIRDGQRIAEVFRAYPIEAVVHFAAAAYVGESVRNPSKYYDVNVTGTLTLLRAIGAAGISKLVFSSSCATYGEPSTALIDESVHQAPINPYGRSKLICEQMIDDLAAVHGFGAIKLRYFNAAGNDPELRIGERHDPETHLIPLAIGAALGIVPHLSIFGDDYDTRDGTCVRDFIHVSDLADAHLKAITRCEPGESHAYNLGGGRGTSVRELVSIVNEIGRCQTPTKIESRRPGDPAELVASIVKARTDLAWAPGSSDIRNIVRDAWNWAVREQSLCR